MEAICFSRSWQHLRSASCRQVPPTTATGTTKALPDAAVITSDSCLCYAEKGWQDFRVRLHVGFFDVFVCQDRQGRVAKTMLAPAHVLPFWGKGLAGIVEGLRQESLKPAVGRSTLVVVCAGWTGCGVWGCSAPGFVWRPALSGNDLYSHRWQQWWHVRDACNDLAQVPTRGLIHVKR